MFIGRESEMNILTNKIQSKQFEFGIIYGRRRVGKTRLLQEVVKNHDAIYFVANELSFDDNIKQLSSILASYFDSPYTFDTLENILIYLAKLSKERDVILIIDEFTYLIQTKPAVLSILQNIIDQHLQNSSLKLLLSGNHVGMIEDSLTYKKPLYGRTTFKIKLQPFKYYEASLFYPKLSNIDKIRLFSVFGGIPFYTNRIDENKSVKENIIELIIESGAIFEDEIEFFLSQEVRSVSTYGRIIQAVANGATKLNQITTKSYSNNSGTISNHLTTLIGLGIIEKDICFGENSNSKKTLYFVKDQLFRFHYRFIERNKARRAIMDPNLFYDEIIAPYLDEFIAFEFENICRDYLVYKNSNYIEDIGRYWFNDRKLKQDIEIDIMMKIHNQLIAYECKWTNSTINQKIIHTLETKVKHLNVDSIGFFAKSGYDDNLDIPNLYTIDDLFKFL